MDAGEGVGFDSSGASSCEAVAAAAVAVVAVAAWSAIFGQKRSFAVAVYP